MTDSSELQQRFEAAGQGHVFAFWERLDGAGRAQLAAELADVDLELVGRLAQLLREEPAHAGGAFEPPEVFPLARDAAQGARAQEAERRGRELLDAGKVGTILVAGGQGSRLGYDGPKGKYPVGPLTRKSLFAWHAARLAAARRRHGHPVPWYVMTSRANDAETRAFFEEHAYFGLAPEDVRFFTQAMLPALDPEGRIVLASERSLFLAPNGHGGTIAAFNESGCADDARARGLEVLTYFQVDNPLGRPADPLFVGLHALERASMSSKFVQKRDAGEKVGVLGRQGGVLGCIEYSDLPDDLRHAKDDAGQLLFGAGNIALHAFDLEFLAGLGAGDLELPWHLARKELATVDAEGRPCKRPGIKFETFVFDALARAERSVTLEVDRALEFSPIKNAEGEDSPATCRAALGALFGGWLGEAGLEAPDGVEGVAVLEVDPTFAESAAEFRERLPHEPETKGGGWLFAPR